MVVNINFFHYPTFYLFFVVLIQTVVLGQILQVTVTEGKADTRPLDLFVGQSNNLSDNITGVDIIICGIITDACQGVFLKGEMYLDLL